MGPGMLIAWILQLLVATGDPGASWKDTYPETAKDMAASAVAEPLFCTVQDAGLACVVTSEDIRKTAALYVSVSWWESRHKRDAIGDGGASVCLGQINKSNFAWLGVTREELLTSTPKCLHAMNRMMRTSLRSCRARPFEDQLAWYVAGGPQCIPNDKGKHRMRKAVWLFDHYPAPAGADFLATGP